MARTEWDKRRWLTTPLLLAMLCGVAPVLHSPEARATDPIFLSDPTRDPEAFAAHMLAPGLSLRLGEEMDAVISHGGRGHLTSADVLGLDLNEVTGPGLGQELQHVGLRPNRSILCIACRSAQAAVLLDEGHVQRELAPAASVVARQLGSRVTGFHGGVAVASSLDLPDATHDALVHLGVRGPFLVTNNARLVEFGPNGGASRNLVVTARLDVAGVNGLLEMADGLVVLWLSNSNYDLTVEKARRRGLRRLAGVPFGGNASRILRILARMMPEGAMLPMYSSTEIHRRDLVDTGLEMDPRQAIYSRYRQIRRGR